MNGLKRNAAGWAVVDDQDRVMLFTVPHKPVRVPDTGTWMSDSKDPLDQGVKLNGFSCVPELVKAFQENGGNPVRVNIRIEADKNYDK